MSKLTVQIAKEISEEHLKGDFATLNKNNLNVVIQIALLKYKEALEEQIQEEGLPIRICDCCGKLMIQGYIAKDYYYCSDECRNTVREYRRSWNRLHKENPEDYYWTQWIN